VKAVNADIAIIGGGPAGCSAALTLRAKGYSVVVIDDVSAREKPTETSSPALKQILGSLGAESAMSTCEPCHGIVSNWGRNAPILKPGMTSPFGNAWFIHRSRFDSYLHQLARDKGTVWLEAKAQKMCFTDDGVEIMANGFQIAARWIVIATGSPTWTANIISQKPNNINSLVAFWAKLPAKLKERLLRIETTDFGWWYSCPGENDQTFVCCVTDVTEARSRQIADFAEWNKHFQKTQIFRQSFGAITATSINITSTSTTSLSLKHGRGWVAAGDAAMKLDPIGSSGVIIALESGRRAAIAVMAAILGGYDSLEKYARWSDQLLEDFSRKRRLQYQLEAQNRSHGFWKRRK
jgi:flavin-dependent dehydrogenase